MRDAAIDPLRHSGRGAARSRAAGAPPLDGVLDEGGPPRGPKGSARQAKASSAAIAAQRLGGGRNVAMSVAQARRRAQPGLLTRLRARLPRVRPLRALTITAFSLALVGIVANAMVFQHGRHPAPLFGLGRSVDGQAEPSQQAAAAPPPAPAPAERTGSLASPPPVAAVEPAPVAVAPKPAPAATLRRASVPRTRHEDGIGGLLATTPGGPAAHPRPGHAARAVAAPARGAETKPGPKPAERPKAQHAAAQSVAAQQAADHRAASEAAGILARPHPATAPAATAAHPRPHPRPAASEARAEPAPKAAAAQ